MAKLVKKIDVKYDEKKGYLLKGNKVKQPDDIVVAQLNALESMLQKKRFDVNANAAMVELNKIANRKFEFDSVRSIDATYDIEVDTPYLDNAVEEAMKIMADIDGKDTAENVKKMMQAYKPVVDWIDDDTYIPSDSRIKFDTKLIGDPTKLDIDKLVAVIREIVE